MTELPGLLAYSEAIARTTAEAMGAPTAVTPAEERALAKIARELQIHALEQVVTVDRLGDVETGVSELQCMRTSTPHQHGEAR